MYERYYGLKVEPFRLSPDSRLCYRHPSFKKAKAYMQYALHRGEGFVMVTGQPGTGKTTLINDLVSGLSGRKVIVAKLVCTQLRADDLLRMVCFSFGLELPAENKALLLRRLEQFLQQAHREGHRPLLIIDEAQDLSTDALEELRLLTNLNQNTRPLIQIFLVGQEGLRETLEDPRLEQLHQRLIAACHLEPLDSRATEDYVVHRLTQVGWKNNPEIEPQIFPFVYRVSLGIPRWINMVCSRLLLHGMVEQLSVLSLDDMRTVVQGLIEEQLVPARLKPEQGLLLEQLDIQCNPRIHDEPASSNAVDALDDTAAQMWIGNRLYNEIRKNPKVAAQVGGPATSDVPLTSDQEIAFVRTFVESIQQLNFEGKSGKISLPPLDGMNFSEFNKLIKVGKQTGFYGVDSRNWAVIEAAFLFLRHEFIRAG